MNVMRTPAGRLRRRAAIGVVGLAALGGGGAAIAATKDSSTSPQAQTSAIVTDAAGQLGVTPAALTAAIKKAMVDQIEAQVTAGTLTKAQAATLEARLAKADAPLFALGRGPGGKGGPGDHGRGGPGGGRISLDAAATYIGVTASQLRTQLAAGKTLATVATDNGKTADGLKTALTAAAKQDLDAAVTAGRLTQAQEDKALADLPARLDEEINEVHTGAPGHGGGPPPAASSSTDPTA
jgi:urease alpha subunit